MLDVYEPLEDWVGLYTNYPLFTDTLELNTHYLNLNTSAQKQNTITHELGHSLGLDHSFPENVMYAYQTSQINLGSHDLSDYSELYALPTDFPLTSIIPASGLNNNPVGISSIGASGSGFTLGWDREIGLLANWRLDETTSGMSVADSSGNDVIGTPSGTSVVAGKLNNARHFTNTTTVNFGDKVDIAQTSPATISFWHKGAPTSGTWIIDKEEDSGQYRGYSAFFLNFSGINLVWRIGQNDVGGKATYCSTASAVPNDNQWHHYAITQQGATSCVNNVI